MEGQPLEILFKQALLLDLPSLNALCQSSQYLHEVLCNNEEFWKDKFKRDFGNSVQARRDFKALYQTYHNLWIVGGPILFMEYPVKTKQVAMGVNHVVFIDINNWAWVMGENTHGQLGLGDNISRRQPTRLALQAQYVTAGNNSTMIVDLSGKVYVWGSNDDLQLGLIQERDYLKPTLLNLYAQQISMGMDRHTLMIDSNEHVWSWGKNQWGQCNPITSNTTIAPTSLGRKAKQVQAGMMYSLILDHLGQVWFWGYNGNIHLNNMPIQALFTIIANNIIEIAAGSAHILMIDVNNEVWAVGNNAYGQLGTGDLQPRSTPVQIGKQAQQISANGAHSMLIDMQGQVWVWGSNRNQSIERVSTPTLIPNLNTYQIATGVYTSALIATKLNF